MMGRIEVRPWWNLVALVAACAGFIVLGLAYRSAVDDGRQAHATLCVFKHDLESQVTLRAGFIQATEAAIRSHPGDPQARVSLAQALARQASQQASFKALAALKC